MTEEQIKRFEEMTKHIRYDPALDGKYGKEIIFKEKHEFAKKQFKKFGTKGLPKDFFK